jgi:hypothetical protein
LWVDKFRNLHKQEFNFSNRYLINYEISSHRLNITKQHNDIAPYFGSNILSIKLIIGENGAGKSNVIDLIKQRLASTEGGSHQVWDEDEPGFIAVFEGMVFCQKSIAISNKALLEGHGFMIQYFKSSFGERKANSEIPTEIIEKKISSVHFIAYSNVYDARQVESSVINLTNISTNYLLRSEKYYDSRYVTARSALDGSVSVESHDVFETNEIERQINFKFFSGNYNLPFEIPNEIWIVNSTPDSNNVLRKSDSWFEEYQIPHFYSLEAEVTDFLRNPKVSDKDKIKANISLNILKVLLIEYASLFKNIERSILIKSVLSADFGKFNFQEYSFLTALGYVQGFLNSLDFLLPRENFKNLAHYEKHQHLSGESIFSFYSRVRFVLTPETQVYFEDLVTNYNKVTAGKKFINFYWRDLSSGEKAMFSLFARFYSLSNSKRLEDKTHLIILMDEGETYFHPQWQKKFISIVLPFLSQTFRDKTIQLIITSNSPFLSSDLPKSCIIFLNKNQQTGLSEVSDLAEMKETFAANIHTLLSDSFFMKGSLLGEFALGILNDLLSYLKGQSSKVKNDQQAQNLINLIGEPLIRRQLQQMLDSKFIGSMKNQFNDFERRLSALEKDKQQP